MSTVSTEPRLSRARRDGGTDLPNTRSRVDLRPAHLGHEHTSPHRSLGRFFSQNRRRPTRPRRRPEKKRRPRWPPLRLSKTPSGKLPSVPRRTRSAAVDIGTPPLALEPENAKGGPAAGPAPPVSLTEASKDEFASGPAAWSRSLCVPPS